MPDCNATCRLSAYLAITTLTYLSELAMYALAMWHLQTHNDVIWSSSCSGVILLSLFSVQVTSFFLNNKSCPSTKATPRADDGTSKKRKCVFVLSHVMFLGQFWHYGRLALSHRMNITRKEIWDCLVLRLLFMFTCTLPMLTVLVYLLFRGELSLVRIEKDWPLVASAGVALISAVTSVVSYQKIRHICCVIGAITHPGGGLAWKVVWRFTEIVARVLSLAVFSLTHGYWVALVVLLHWITMAVLLIIDISMDRAYKGKVAFRIFTTSFVHIFLQFNTSKPKSMPVVVLYYVISCLECVTLLVLWVLYEEDRSRRLPVSLAVAACQVCAMAFAYGYYSCLHRNMGDMKHDMKTDDVCLVQCMRCRLRQLGRSEPARPYHAAHVTVTENPNPHLSDFLHPVEYANVSRQEPPLPGPSGISNSEPNRRRNLPEVHRAGYRRRHGDRDRDTSTDCELSWDDYDINELSDTTDYSTFPQPRARSNQDMTSPARTNHKKAPVVVLDPSKKPKDQGYFSGISSSSKDANASSSDQQPQYAEPPIGVANSRPSIPLFPNNCNGFWSDDASSTITSISSHMPGLGCNRCGHFPQDNLSSVSSMSCTTSSTANTSLHELSHILGLRVPDTRPKYKRKARPKPNRTQVSGADRSACSVNTLVYINPSLDSDV